MLNNAVPTSHGGYYYFNGLSWVVAPLAFPYGGLPLNGDFIYREREVSNDVYPYAIPTADADIVISPFALNNLVNVAGAPPAELDRLGSCSCVSDVGRHDGCDDSLRWQSGDSAFC